MAKSLVTEDRLLKQYLNLQYKRSQGNSLPDVCGSPKYGIKRKLSTSENAKFEHICFTFPIFLNIQF